jgi:hypothetical protein
VGIGLSPINTVLVLLEHGDRVESAFQVDVQHPHLHRFTLPCLGRLPAGYLPLGASHASWISSSLQRPYRRGLERPPRFRQRVVAQGTAFPFLDIIERLRP